MEANKILRLTAKVRIDPIDRHRFIQITGELKAIVVEEGSAQVLNYDCYFKDLHTKNSKSNSKDAMFSTQAASVLKR